MGRQLMRITPSIISVAKEYLELKREGQLPRVHVADCFPIPPEQILEVWDSARFELRRRSNSSDFELAHIIVFKDGSHAAEYVPINAPNDQPSLFD